MKINFIASLFGAISVVIGALRAHYLKDKLPEESLNSLATAVYFALFHIPMLLYINTNDIFFQKLFISKVPVFLLAGILCFSGSIYLLVFLKPFIPKYFGFITPIGGVLLILSWVLIAISFLNKK